MTEFEIIKALDNRRRRMRLSKAQFSRSCNRHEREWYGLLAGAKNGSTFVVDKIAPYVKKAGMTLSLVSDTETIPVNSTADIVEYLEYRRITEGTNSKEYSRKAFHSSSMWSRVICRVRDGKTIQLESIRVFMDVFDLELSVSHVYQ